MKQHASLGLKIPVKQKRKERGYVETRAMGPASAEKIRVAAILVLFFIFAAKAHSKGVELELQAQVT